MVGVGGGGLKGGEGREGGRGQRVCIGARYLVRDFGSRGHEAGCVVR